MIITVTLNAAIDRTLEVPNFRLGRRHRSVEQTRRWAARASTSRARSNDSTSPWSPPASRAGRPGTRLVEGLTSESVLNDFVRTRRESRTNITIVDPSDHR